MSDKPWMKRLFMVQGCHIEDSPHDHQQIGGIIFCIYDDRQSTHCWSHDHRLCNLDDCICTCHNPLRMTPVLQEVADILGIKFSE